MKPRSASDLRKYGITPEQYEQMFEKQNGVCAICHRTNPGGKPLVVDHDHKTGQVRGLLCQGCNFGLGWMEDNIGIFVSAIRYLSRFRSASEMAIGKDKEHPLEVVSGVNLDDLHPN